MEKKEFIKLVDAIIKPFGFIKKGNEWYLVTPELIKVINLQRSSFGNSYYLNFGFQIPEFAEKHPDVHVSFGLSSLDEIENQRIRSLLDLDEDIPSEVRKDEIMHWIEKKVVKLLQSINTENDLQNYLKTLPDFNLFRLFIRKRFGLE